MHDMPITYVRDRLSHYVGDLAHDSCIRERMSAATVERSQTHPNQRIESRPGYPPSTTKVGLYVCTVHRPQSRSSFERCLQ